MLNIVEDDSRLMVAQSNAHQKLSSMLSGSRHDAAAAAIEELIASGVPKASPAVTVVVEEPPKTAFVRSATTSTSGTLYDQDDGTDLKVDEVAIPGDAIVKPMDTPLTRPDVLSRIPVMKKDPLVAEIIAAALRARSQSLADSAIEIMPTAPKDEPAPARPWWSGGLASYL